MVLLITITLAAAGTLYTTTQNFISSQPPPDIGLKLTEIQFEHCYNEASQTHMVLRNGHAEAMNTSKIDVFLDARIHPRSNYTTSPEIVDPQKSFEIVLDSTISSDTQVMITSDDNSKKFKCLSLQ